MSVVAVIPARYDSTRLPGKPLLDRTGRTLIEHVVEAVDACDCFARIIVATDDQRIARAIENSKANAEVAMTRRDHPNGTSRIAEAIETMAIEAPLIVNVQGDEPEIDPVTIRSLIEVMQQDPEVPMGTVGSPFDAETNPANPNVVKVVTTVTSPRRALYFSRSLVPFPRQADKAPVLKHLGLYAYRREFLSTYLSLSSTPLEQSESLEQLRVLEHGHPIGIAITDSPHPGIDTPEQYDAFVERYLARQ